MSWPETEKNIIEIGDILRKSEGEWQPESALDGQAQSVSVRGMESFNDPYRIEDVSQKRD